MDVDHTGRDGGGAVYCVLRIEGPDGLTGPGVEAFQGVVVARADEDATVVDACRRVDLRAVPGPVPHQTPVGGVVAAEVSSDVTDVQATVHHGGAGPNVQGEGLVPDLVAGVRLQSPHDPPLVGEVDGVVPQCGGGHDLVGLSGPDEGPVIQLKAVGVTVGCAEVHPPFRDEGCGLNGVCGLEGPDLLTTIGVEAVELPVVAPHQGQTVDHREAAINLVGKVQGPEGLVGVRDAAEGSPNPGVPTAELGPCFLAGLEGRGRRQHEE